MPWHEYVGTVGSLLMFSTFWMRTMIPLRAAAIAANLAMVTYAWLSGLYPIMVMQALMLPVNVYRLVQMRRLTLRVAAAHAREFDPAALLPFMTRERHRDGDVLFRAGDPSDRMYFIRAGRVRLLDVDLALGEGEILGEIGVVSPHNRRTATAVCEGDTVLMSIDAGQVRQLYFQEPEFGFYLMQLVTQRLLENLDHKALAADA